MTRLLPLIVLFNLLATQANAEILYIVTDIGDLPTGSDTSEVFDINDNGVVVGRSDISIGSTMFLWDKQNGLTDLGIPTGSGADFRQAGINSSNQVVGFSTGAPGIHGFFWDPVSGLEFLENLAGGSEAVGNDINDAGQIAGSAETSQFEFAAVLWDDQLSIEQLTNVPGYAGRYTAHATNNSNEVVGTTRNLSMVGFTGNLAPENRAFIWDAANGMRDLGMLPNGSDTEAEDINDAGQVVGSSFVVTNNRAYSWTEGRGMRELPVIRSDLGSNAFGINNLGQIVGASPWPVTWIDGRVFELQDSLDPAQDIPDQLELFTAKAVNNRGEIIVDGRRSDGGCCLINHGFVLEPTYAGIVHLPDISGNGAGEIAVSLPGSTRVDIRDSADGALIQSLDFGSDQAFDMQMIPDIDGNGFPEIGVLLRKANGQVRVLAKDVQSGATNANIFFGDEYSAIELAVTADMNANGSNEIAVLGLDNLAETSRIQIRDTLTGAAIKNLYLGDRHLPTNMTFIDDVSVDGIPDLAATGVNFLSGQINTRVRNAATASQLQTMFWGNTYEPVETLSVSDINASGNPEIVSLGYDRESGASRLQVRDSLTRTPISTSYLGNTHKPIDIEIVSDTNGNSAPDVAVLFRTATDTGLVRIYDSLTGALIRNLFFSTVSRPMHFTSSGDSNANAADELAVMGFRGGERHVQIKDTLSGALISDVPFVN